MRRSARTRGSLWKIDGSKDTWQIVVSLGRDPKTGKYPQQVGTLSRYEETG